MLTRAVDRTVRCAPPPGRGPKARSAAHVCGTTACTLGWVSGIARRRAWLAMRAGYSTGTPRPSTARTEEAHPSASTAAACCRPTLCTVILRLCTAPTRVPTGTPAPTNVGDTNPPTLATTFAPTRAPNFADPTGEGDLTDATYLPSLPPSPPFLPPFLLPPPPCRSLHCIALGPPPGG